ncbi:MAG: FAD-dependent monooxygenase, partial [Actinomycetota bacterium]|nr:FAD-dependent monooxygenase [Actinomycetota bacterium]
MHDVLIVGGGPVGLFMAALLLQQGLDVRVLEQRTERSTHSRAIGIHPPALDALDSVGVSAGLLVQGVQIRRGLARSGGRDVAGLSFATVSAAHPYVLAVPQERTESALEARVRELSPAALIRGVRVDSMHDDGGSVTLNAVRNGGSAFTDDTAGPAAGPTAGPAAGPPDGQAPPAEYRAEYRARLVLAADGARSTIRDRLGIPTTVRDYPDHYVMGDFADGTADGTTAVLYLEPGGIVESFPLPGNLRRWVVHTDGPLSQPTADQLAGLIRERTGAAVDPSRNSMLSAFSVRARLARRLVQGRVALIGDAAHEISPIGGQGMNLGWLDAAAFAPIIGAALEGAPVGRRLRTFERTRQRAAGRAVWQSHLNMALGRPLPAPVMAARNR